MRTVFIIAALMLFVSCGGGSGFIPVVPDEKSPEAVTYGSQSIGQQSPPYGDYGLTAEIAFIYPLVAEFNDLVFHIGDTDNAYAYRTVGPYRSEHNGELEVLKWVDGEWSSSDTGLPFYFNLADELGGLPYPKEYVGFFLVDNPDAWKNQRFYVEVINTKTGKTSEKYWFPDYIS